ncbi:MAG TPA: DUF3617 family protein [Steroidobacteraceae bacterium]|nr:DUF3617 family protein [Steroidobacteraceae bacterium]
MNYRKLLTVACLGGIGAVSATDLADQLPHYKPGLWDITLMMASRPGDEKICLDKATENQMRDFGSGVNKNLCSKTEVHASGSQYTSVATCRGQTVRTVLTFSGDSAYHADITAGDRKSSLDAKWLGACPADMQAGDVVVTIQGMKPMRMNLKAMLGK